MGLDPVGELAVLAGEEAKQDQRLPRRYVWTPGGVEERLQPAEVVFFTATLPGSPAEAFGLARYQPAARDTPGDTGWSWASVLRVSELRTIANLMDGAAELGLEVVQACGGMVFTSRRDETGEVQTEQRWAFDPETF